MARAITSHHTCPALTIDGKPHAMQVRSQPSLPLYPVTSCEAALPATATSATLNQTALPLPS